VHSLTHCLFALERQNIGQKGFNALIHRLPRYSTRGPPIGL
jgi:hypothetical protein